MINPDFVKLAEAMGAKGIRAKTAEELPAAMKEFLEYDGSRPVLLECFVDKEGEWDTTVMPASMDTDAFRLVS